MIERLLTIFHDVLGNLRDDKTACTFECNSILLGAFIKDLPPDLLWPRPSRPFTGLSFVYIARISHHLKSPHWYSEPRADVDGEFDVDGLLRRETEHPVTFKKKKKLRLRRYAGDVDGTDPVEAHACTLQALIAPEIDFLEASIQGLEL